MELGEQVLTVTLVFSDVVVVDLQVRQLGEAPELVNVRDVPEAVAVEGQEANPIDIR